MRWWVICAVVLACVAVSSGAIYFVTSDNSRDETRALSVTEKMGAVSSEILNGDNRSFYNEKASVNVGMVVLSIALIVLSFSLLLSVGISFYLYRWRKVLLSKPHMTVPEEFGAWVTDLNERVGSYLDFSSKSTTAIAKLGEATRSDMSALTETFMTLQTAISEREEEIKRLRAGYDAEIFRRFLLRFIRVDQAAEDFERLDRVDPEAIGQLRRLLADAFAECRLEIYRPVAGEDYRNAVGVADNPKVLPCDNPDFSYTIAEVVEAGYVLRGSERPEVVVPAKVKIFMFEE